jgi:hypothetical protein
VTVQGEYGLGDMPDALGAAADLGEHAPILEGREAAFAWAADAVDRSVDGLLLCGQAAALDWGGDGAFGALVALVSEQVDCRAGGGGDDVVVAGSGQVLDRAGQPVGYPQQVAAAGSMSACRSTPWRL